MNVERVGFGKPSITFSPMKIIPEGGGDIHVHQIHVGNGKAESKIGFADPDVQHDAVGSLTLHIGKNEMRVPKGGMVTVPDGGTVEVYPEKSKSKKTRFEVHSGQNNPTMVREPEASRMRPIEGNNPITREGFFWGPNGPEMGAWDEKPLPPHINRREAEQILGFDVEPILKSEIVKQPKQSRRDGDPITFTDRDIVNAYRAQQLHETSDAPWRLIANAIRIPLSGSDIAQLKTDTHWKELILRAKQTAPELNFDALFAQLERQAQRKK